jgi:hypothetical protein
MRLHDHDTPLIARPFPEMTAALKLVISESNCISPTVVPEIIKSLPNIRAVYIHLYMGRLETGWLACDTTCFGSDINVPNVTTKHHPYDLKFACQYQLRVARTVTARRMASECDKSGEPIYEETSIGMTSLEEEVREWLKNPTCTLDSITLCFDRGRELFNY